MEGFFQFLIKGYDVNPFHELLHDNFQFLIKGYPSPVNPGVQTQGPFQFLIKGYIYEMEQAHPGTIFQFLIKGYTLRLQGCTKTQGFQFLIKGYNW